ncbi:unnamed protein product, partial [Rotaria magnacalcarata]
EPYTYNVFIVKPRAMPNTINEFRIMIWENMLMYSILMKNSKCLDQRIDVPEFWTHCQIE